jgi:hypothetical protein
LSLSTILRYTFAAWLILTLSTTEQSSLFADQGGSNNNGTDNTAGEPEVDIADGGLPFSVDIGATVVSAYWWRGYVYENNGLITQPYIELGFPVSDGGADGPSIEAYVGMWNSLHSEKTDATDTSVDAWYETDLYAGLVFEFESFDLEFIYTFYIYPNNEDFDDVQEAGIILGWYPDEECWLGWLLGEPTVGIFGETRRSNVGDGPSEAAYLQIDFGPSVDLIPEKITATFPVQLGLSIDDYYEGENGEDETFGFVSVGVDLEIPLGTTNGIEATLNIGAVGIILGDNAQEYNETSDTEGYLYANIGFSF